MHPSYPIYFQTGCKKSKGGGWKITPDLSNEVPKVLKGDLKIEE